MSDQVTVESHDPASLIEQIAKAVHLVEDKMLRIGHDKAIHHVTDKRGI